MVDANWSAKDASIKKFLHNVLQKDYAGLLNVDSTFQLFFQRIFLSNIFTNMMKSNNFALKKIIVLEMRLYLETKFNKTLSSHIKDVMITFNKPPDPNKPIGT